MKKQTFLLIFLYLPDLSNPQYMAVNCGPGAAKADIKLSDCVLTTSGVEYDPVLPETVQALAALVSDKTVLREVTPVK